MCELFQKWSWHLLDIYFKLHNSNANKLLGRQLHVFQKMWGPVPFVLAVPDAGYIINNTIVIYNLLVCCQHKHRLIT